MTRRIVGAKLTATCLMAVFAPAATAASVGWAAVGVGGDPVVVKIAKQAQIAGGGVLVSLRGRCEPRLSAFELDVSVLQGAAFGSTSIVQAGVVTCDGRWQSVEVAVSPFVGSFAPGTATVEVFLGAFDQVEGDLEGTDTETVRLRQ